MNHVHMIRQPVLDVRRLSVWFGRLQIVSDMSFELCAGETVALVGESGSGKSVSSLALMGLLPPRDFRVTAEATSYQSRDGRTFDLHTLHSRAHRRVRGKEIAMIFQEPLTALNPVISIGKQIREVIQIHEPKVPSGTVYRRAIEALDRVGLADAERVARSYPHQLSGGMRQRVMIAMALACRPRVLIADEPTTALDVTVQAQILSLIKQLQRENGMSVLFITHDLGVVSQVADRVIVMYAGREMEKGTSTDILHSPHHPYTRGLLRSIPHHESLTRSSSRIFPIPGSPLSSGDFVEGCKFGPRCSHFRGHLCAPEEPALLQVGDSNFVRCVRWEKIQEEEHVEASH